MKEEEKQKQIAIFTKLYEEFIAKCKKEGIIPVPALMYRPMGVIPYLDFTQYKEDIKEEAPSAP